jgi:hypothetical protein
MNKYKEWSNEMDGLPLKSPKEERQGAKNWMDEAGLHMKNEQYWKKCATALWLLLDDISTLDDMYKLDNAMFRHLAMKIQLSKNMVFTEIDKKDVDDARKMLEEQGATQIHLKND